MKAACLLLCLALHQSAAHIFRRQQQRMQDGSLIVQPLYIDQQQQPMQQRYNQKKWSSENKHSSESQSSENVEKQRYSKKQRYEPRQYNDEYQKDQQSYIKDQYQRKYLKNKNYDDSMQSAESQPRMQYQKRYQSESSEYEPKQLKHKTTQKKYTQHDSSSNESREKKIPDSSSSSSEEVKNTFRKDSMKPSITWNGIQIPVTQKTLVTKKDIQEIFGDAYETLSHVSEEDKQMFRQQLAQAEQTDNEDARLNATELLNKNQYPVEEHTIKTDDGYLLTLFRIVKDTSVPRPVVLLMHGLLGSADDWLLMGPGKALAYQLADAGYDVWLGNARGNKYSRRHVTKHPAQSDFWQFSTDEIAQQDLPAMIDYVLDISKQSNLVYVGHSLGTTAFFALAASRPEYNGKITMMFAMSPMAYMSNTRSPLLRMIAPTNKMQRTLHHQLGHGKFSPSNELVSIVGGAMIEKAIGVKSVAKNINFVMSGVDVEDLDAKLIPVIMAHQPAGGSTRQVKQYGQAVASNDFTKYDFGAYINQLVYGSSMPPKYNLKNVQTPVVLFYSEEDWLAHPRDVERLAQELPNATVAKVAEPHFGSMAFQLSEKAPAAVYKKLIESISAQPQQTLNFVY